MIPLHERREGPTAVAVREFLSSFQNELSRKHVLHRLDIFAQTVWRDADCVACDWANLRVEGARKAWWYITAHRPRFANVIFSAVRQLMKVLYRRKEIRAEHYLSIVDALPKADIGPAPLRGRVLTDDQVAGLFRVCGNSADPADVRDRALFSVGFTLGLYRSEYAVLQPNDYDGAHLMVAGSDWGRERLLEVGPAKPMLDHWLTMRGEGDGALFCPVRKGGHILPYDPVTDQSIYAWVTQRAAAAGFTAVPTDLRATAYQRMIDGGMHPLRVLERLGVDRLPRWDASEDADAEQVA